MSQIYYRSDATWLSKYVKQRWRAKRRKEQALGTLCELAVLRSRIHDLASEVQIWREQVGESTKVRSGDEFNNIVRLTLSHRGIIPTPIMDDDFNGSLDVN